MDKTNILDCISLAKSIVNGVRVGIITNQESSDDSKMCCSSDYIDPKVGIAQLTTLLITMELMLKENKTCGPCNPS